jgi:hypothetical protein
MFVIDQLFATGRRPGRCGAIRPDFGRGLRAGAVPLAFRFVPGFNAGRHGSANRDASSDPPSGNPRNYQ